MNTAYNASQPSSGLPSAPWFSVSWAVDLDGFKGVNDQHDHAAGDQVLTAFAASANSFMSEVQIAGRLGGDEFAIAIAVFKTGA